MATAIAVALSALPSFADPLTGQVTTKVRQGSTPATAVIYAEPLDGTGPPPRPAPVSLTQKNKRFSPRVLGVAPGTTINFPNDDAIFHNVFSLSPPQPFDLGLYRAGASKSRTFAAPAAYHVFCNIHPQMAAFIVVAPTSWVTTAAADGTWRLDLPPGRYRVSAVSERAGVVRVEAAVPARDVALALDESAPIGPRLNKFGKPYPKEAYKGPERFR